jgi:hypothetical protein
LILGPPDPAYFNPKYGLTYTPVLPMYGAPASTHSPTINPSVSMPRMWFVHLERMMIGNTILTMCGVRGNYHLYHIHPLIHSFFF